MVGAARELLRERGYHSMALSEVVQRGAAPRGSVYHHFPQGKAQLAAAAADVHAGEQVDVINRLGAAAATAEELAGAFVDVARDGMRDSGYGRGCAVAPLVTEVGTASDELAAASRRAYFLMVETLALRFVVLGVAEAGARELAHAVVAGVQGALVTSRALRGTEPFAAVRAAVVSLARTL
jgi:TetR/AcrR family transcriptional regulator, lmrAB and yxaGH operons repressor